MAKDGIADCRALSKRLPISHRLPIKLLLKTATFLTIEQRSVLLNALAANQTRRRSIPEQDARSYLDRIDIFRFGSFNPGARAIC